MNDEDQAISKVAMKTAINMAYELNRLVKVNNALIETINEAIKGLNALETGAGELSRALKEIVNEAEAGQ